MAERMLCLDCGTVTSDMLCDCNRWPDGHEMKREPNFVNYTDSLQQDLQEVMGINNRLREVLLEVRQFINDAPLGDGAHSILATIDATVR